MAASGRRTCPPENFEIKIFESHQKNFVQDEKSKKVRDGKIEIPSLVFVTFTYFSSKRKTNETHFSTMEFTGIITYPSFGIMRDSSRDHEMIEHEMDVLDEGSLEEVRTYAADALGSLVFRRIKSVRHFGEPTYWYHAPSEDSLRPLVVEMTKEEVDALPWEEFVARVETRTSKKYTFTTFASSVFPAEDDINEPISGSSFGRSELDPVSLCLSKTPSSRAAAPRAIKPGVKRHQGDPASLVAGFVRRNKFGKLEFTRWFIASEQCLKAVLMLTHPEQEIPYETLNGEGQIKSGPAAYAFWMGGNRLVTNTARKEFLSEMSNGTSFSQEEKVKRYIIHVGERLSVNCHTLAFWVLLVKYGQVCGNNNIPTTTPQPLPSDPVKRAAIYVPKPMRFWDLPVIVSNRKPTRLDQLVIETLGLSYHRETLAYPVNVRTLHPEPREPKLSQLAKVEGLQTLVVSAARPSSPVDEVEYEGLSQSGSSDEDRPPTPEPLVQVYSWADQVDLEEEMDFSQPLQWASDEARPTSFFGLPSFLGGLIKT